MSDSVAAAVDCGDVADLTVLSASQTLARACAAAGLDPAGAALLRVGEHAVFRLAEPVVVRIARTRAYEADARKEVAVARWLEDDDYPAVRALRMTQPLVIDDRTVTFWEAVADDEPVYGTPAEVADLLGRLHALVAPDGVGLTALQPFARSRLRIGKATWLSAGDREFLLSRQADCIATYEQLKFELPSGIIHGDASVGNVLHDSRGMPVLIDLDGCAIGPREWDLVLTAMYYDSFGWHTAAEYRDFADTYGYDVMQWPGYPVLRDIREFLMVTWLGQKGADNELAAAEVRKRITALRTGASKSDWQPF